MNFEELRRLASGYQLSALFIQCLEVGVFDALGSETVGAKELAGRIGCEARATEIAANALAALGILEREGDSFRNTGDTIRFLVKRSPEYKGSILRHLGSSWNDYSRLSATLKSGSACCERKEGSVPRDEGQLADFILGMENMTREAAPLLAQRLPLEGCRKILDLGAGPGNYCLAFAARAPDARLVHFDLPATSRVASGFIAGKPGSERIEFMTGDFLVDPIGDDYDFIWLSQILHMLGETEANGLLRKAGAALGPGGILAVHEHFLNDDLISPLSAALFGVHMLTVTKAGRTYSLGEVAAWMRECGLLVQERLEYGGPSRVLFGRRG